MISGKQISENICVLEQMKYEWVSGTFILVPKQQVYPSIQTKRKGDKLVKPNQSRKDAFIGNWRKYYLPVSLSEIQSWLKGITQTD